MILNIIFHTIRFLLSLRKNHNLKIESTIVINFLFVVGFCRNLSRGQGKILIHAEEVSNTNAELTLKFEAEKLDKKDVFGKSDPYFEISRVNESGDYSVVFRYWMGASLFIFTNYKWKTEKN